MRKTLSNILINTTLLVLAIGFCQQIHTVFKRRAAKLKAVDNTFYQLFSKRVCTLLGVAFFSLFTMAASAQQLGTYTFTGLLLGTCPNNNNTVTTQPANATFSPYTNVGADCLPSTTTFLNDNWNTGLTILTTEYNQFTITPDPGYLLTLTSLTLTHDAKDNNNTTWALRTSLDNFATDCPMANNTVTTTTQTVTVNLAAAKFTNIGAVTFRLYLIDAKGPKTDWMNDDVTVNGTVVKIPANPANPSSNSPQCASSGVTLSYTGTPPAGETWYWQTSPTGTSTANSSSTYTVFTSGTYYLRSRDNTTLAWSSGSGSVTVNAIANVTAPLFAMGASSSRCIGAETINYTASAFNSTGITYSLDAASIAGGNGINSVTGDVTFAAAWSGTSIVTASAAGCSGPQTSTHTITTNVAVSTPMFASGTSTRCQGANTVTYTASANNTSGITYSLDAASIAGGNTINSGNGTVTYAAGWSGTSTITASAAGCFGPLTATHTVTTTATVGTPVFTLGANSTRCVAGETVTYTATASTNTGITYSLDAASLAAGNTIDVNTGDVTFDNAWTGTSVITATATGCNGPKSATHTVTTRGPVAVPVFTAGATTTRCQGTGTVNYGATANNATSITYTLDAASLAGGNTINASSGAVTYSSSWSGTSVITASAAGCYGPQTASHTVTITPSVGTPVFTLGSSSTRCQGAGQVLYDASATTTTGITYSLNAASLSAGNTINSATGEVTFTAAYTGTSIITASAAGCNGPKTSTHTVTVVATVGTPVFTSGATSSRCQAAGTVPYTATATTNTGITYSLDAASLAAGNTIDAATGAVTYNAAWFGTSVITATATGCNGPKSADHTVTINPPVTIPIFALGATSTRCQGAGAVSYTATADNATGITYSLDAASITGGNTINSGTGLVTYAAGWSGTSTITARAAGCFGPLTQAHVVTITPTVGTPVFAMGSASSRCQASSTVTYTATATTNTSITYSLDAASIAAGNVIDTTSGDVTYDPNWVGTSVITATAFGCNGPKTSTHTVTTNAPVTVPVFTLGATSVRCQGSASLNYTAAANNTTGITYTLDAASLAGGNTIVSTSGRVTFAAGWSGTTTITASAAGCYGPQTETHVVTVTPTVGTPVFTAGATSTRCQGAATILYDASATTNTGITYTINAASATAGNTINSATGEVTFVATYSGTTIITATATGCNGPKSATHTVTVTATVGIPVFTAGATTTRCQGSGTVPYGATATTNTGISYSLDSGSLAGGNTINTSTGAVTYVASWNGTSIITATATGCNGPSTASHTVTITPTVGVPVFTLGTTSVRCQGAGTVPYTASSTNSTAISYTLDLASRTAGNTINSSTGAVTFVAGWTGTSTVTASATGCNGPKTSTHTITITPTVGTPVFALGASTSRCQAAGVVNYTASASNSTGITYALDNTSLAAGNTIDVNTGDVTYDASWFGTSTITATAAGCNGPKTATHTVTTNAPVTAPVFAAGATSVRCQGAATVPYTATANNKTGLTYSLDAASLAGGNTINTATGAVTYSAGWSGTSTITATATGCYGPQTETHVVTITPSVTTPVFTAGASSVRCQGAGTISYSASVANTTGVTYSLNAASIAGGNTIDATNGDVTYAATWSGTTIITVSANGCNGPKTATHTVTVTPTVGTPVFAMGATSTRCQAAGNVIYTATSTNSTGMSYTLDATSTAAGNTINATNGTVTYVASWTGTSVITATSAGCNGPSATTIHTVTTTPIVGTPIFTNGASSIRCQGVASVPYTATSTNTTGITYALDAASITGGNTINSSTGVVTYAAGWAGTSIITANAAGCSGPAIASHTVTITPTVGTPVFTKGATSSRCQAAGVISYSASVTNTTGVVYTLDAASLAGGNTIDAASGDVTYDANWFGTSVITATASGCNGPKTATHTVTTNAPVTAPLFTAGTASVRCQGAGTVTYSASANNSTGITYSLDAASTAGGNTINTTNGAITFTAAWTGTSVITATATGCFGPLSSTHTITITPTVGTPVFTGGATSTRCQGAANVPYTANATTTTGITYSLDPASITGGNTINASTGVVSFAAGWSGTTTITASAAGCNGPKTATHVVTITPTVGTPIFTLGATTTRCQGAGSVTYTASATTNTGISYSLDAASIAGGNTINTSTGAVTYVASWNGTTTITATATGCNGPSTASHTVTVTPTVGNPVFTLGSTSVRCQGAGPVSYSAASTNSTSITYSLDAASTTGGNTINSSTGVVTFVAGWTGTSTVTASAAGCNGPKTSTHIITTTPTVGTPVFTAGATSSRCQAAGTATYTANATNSTGITYTIDAASISGGNTIDANTGTVSYAAGWFGTTTITATAAGCNGPKTASHTVTINAPVTVPVFAAGATSVRCQGAGSVPYTASASNTTGITYSLDAASLTGGNSINASTGVVTYVAGWSGTSTITASAAGCSGPQTATHTVTITPTVGTPVFTVGATSSRCQAAGTFTYAASATTTTGITYSLDAASISGGNTINSSTGLVTFAAAWFGTSTITASAAGCNGPKTSTHLVTTNAPVTTPVFTLGATSTRCQGAVAVTYTATANNTSGITYSIDPSSAAAGNIINPSTGVLTYTAGWSGTTFVTASAAGCYGPLTATHTVTITPSVGTPVFADGNSSTRCNGPGTVSYAATATNTTGITYSLDATSIAGGNTINASTGTVTYIAGWVGTATITARATGCSGPITANHIAISTPSVTTPVFTLGATSSRCQGAGTVTYAASASNTSGIVYTLDGTSLTNGNTIDANTGKVTYVANWLGTTTITATANGCNGPKVSTHTVTVNPNGTPAFALGPNSTRLQSGNSVAYTATASNGAAVTYTLDATSLAAGNTINSATGVVTYSPLWVGVSVITATATGCNGAVSATHTVMSASSTVLKQLYLTDPAQTLDRIDPVATGDNTGSSTNTLSTAASVVAVANSTSGSGTTNVISVAHATAAGADRFMLVSIAYPTTGSTTIQSVTYGGVALSLAGTTSIASPKAVAIYKLASPAVGSANVVVTFNNAVVGGAVVGVTTYTGVDQVSPLNTFASGSGIASNASLNVASAANEMVFAAVSANTTVTATSGTSRWSIAQGSTFSGGLTQTGAFSATASFSIAGITSQKDWVMAGISLKPASSVTTTSFTQSPALCSPLIIKANPITVTTYVSVTSGTMPTNPAITAVLRYGATNIITLTNPVYNSTTNTLKWTGTTAGDVNIPAGQAITLDISTAQAGVSFHIDYDSQTEPSKIDIPVSTYIDIAALDVYDAPYPGGQVKDAAVTGATNYVRAVVNDPFGYNDITALNIAISSGGGTVAATSVAASGCTRVFEYAWKPATGANYNLIATAKEGFENTVTATRTVNFTYCTNCPPVAVDDSGTGAGGSPIIVDVLANDYDPNNNINPGSITIVTQPLNGDAVVSGGKVIFLPNGTFSGYDEFTYQVCDLTSPTPLCATAKVKVSIDPTIVDPCTEASRSHVYYIPFPEQDTRTALIKSTNATFLPIPSDNIRTIISVKILYPNMRIVWDHWEDGYEADIMNPVQSTTQVWGDGNPYNGIAPGYPDDNIPAGGSIVLDNTIPSNPRVAANIFFDGRDKVYSSGQVTLTQVSGEPSIMGLQCMKTNVSSTDDFGKSFTIPVGENFNSQDFRYTALFIRAAENNTIVSIDKDKNGTFETIDTLNEGESALINGGVLTGATVTSDKPIGVDLHFGGVDGYSSREVPIYPATWYSNVYYSPVPTTGASTAIKDTSVVMLYNNLNRPININWSSGIPSSGTINLPAKTVVRFPLALSATAAYKFVNPTGESFTAIEIVDSYTPGSGANSGSTYDWAFNLISEERLTTFAAIAWAPGSTDGTRNDNPIWVTPSANTTIYVKYNGDVLNGGLVSPCGLHYDVSYPLNALKHKRLLDSDNDQSGLAVFTCDGTKLAAVYGEDPSTATSGNPSWDVGSTIRPYCATKLVFAADDYAYTLTDRPVTIQVLSNDGGFSAVIDPATVSTSGFVLQPKHGTVSVNPNGTLLYTPHTGFTGADTLEYRVCSTPTPVVCDVASVFIIVNACPTPANKNIITGRVFLDKNKDGLFNDGSVGMPGAKVYLYADGNCNAIAEPNELKDSIVVDNSGSYQFITYPENTISDNFENGAASTCASGSDGSKPWLTNWVDAGDPSVGYCVTPAQSYLNTNVEVVKDGLSNTYALRLKNPSASATRTANLSGANAAFLSFSYRKAAPLAAGKNIYVQASSNGSTFTTIFTIAGNGLSNSSYVDVYNQDISAFTTANTYIRFLTSASMGNTDTVYIDNVTITYLKYPICYITKLDQTTINSDYYFSTATQNAMTASNGGTCMFPFDFGVARKIISVGGVVYNDVNGLTDNLVNGVTNGAPSGNTLYAYLVDSSGNVAFKTTVNSLSGVYTFPNADIKTMYTVTISTIDSPLYKPAPASVLPDGWVSVGESYGLQNLAGTGVKVGMPNGIITATTGVFPITNINFGIEVLPFAGKGLNKTNNPGGTISYPIPANTFLNILPSSDAAPGTVTKIRITGFPAGVISMTINGVMYYNYTFPPGGVVVPTNASGQPTQVISVDPVDGYVRAVIPFYAVDNAGKESLAQGEAVMLFLVDTDNDGVPDVDDIDDDNDGITDFVETCGAGATTFSCLPGGSDPAGDDDNDGIVNYRDADYGVLNAKGTVSILDSDGDGVPDFLDLDSDNDGIADVVEAKGVDANGDGIIDNYCDTDGDGLSQNVDANNTGKAGSGQGLGAPDFDGDGVPNALDLDSDNDGIPDLVESFGTDANNNGRVDSFVDSDGDGWTNQYDGDANGDGIVENLMGVLVLTGPDPAYVNCASPGTGRPGCYTLRGNSDNHGLPNFLDLDSDGDGITDAVESGITAASYFRSMVSSCTLVNGWCTAISSLPSLALLNTDNNGKPDAYDIDSDNDGITDNIEAQPTASHIVATDADADGDGIATVYDFYNGIGGNGLTPYDHDADGTPDYRDLDADNDGAPDRNEGDKRNLGLTQATINASGDADGDGLMDIFDIFNLLAQSCSYGYMNVAMSNMGASGNWNGPAPGGSNIGLTQSMPTASNRDWRNTTVLPLHIISFSGNLNGNSATLTWKVENEQQVDKYVVERSEDGVHYDATGIRFSTNSSAATYTYVDDLSNYAPSVVYYRIQQMDKDSKSYYTKTILFNLNKNVSPQIVAYPNPVDDQLTISIPALSRQSATISFTDVSGKTVIQKTVSLQKGDNKITLYDVEHLSKGLYLLQVKTLETSSTIKLIKQ